MGVCQGYTPILWAHRGFLECEMGDLCQMEALEMREKKNLLLVIDSFNHLIGTNDSSS